MHGWQAFFPLLYCCKCQKPQGELLNSFPHGGIFDAESCFPPFHAASKIDDSSRYAIELFIRYACESLGHGRDKTATSCDCFYIHGLIN